MLEISFFIFLSSKDNAIFVADPHHTCIGYFDFNIYFEVILCNQILLLSKTQIYLKSELAVLVLWHGWYIFTWFKIINLWYKYPTKHINFNQEIIPPTITSNGISKPQYISLDFWLHSKCMMYDQKILDTVSWFEYITKVAGDIVRNPYNYTILMKYQMFLTNNRLLWRSGERM